MTTTSASASAQIQKQGATHESLDYGMSMDALRRRVDTELAQLLDRKLQELPDAGLAPWIQVLRSFVVEGGKRMRAVFCSVGFRGAGGNPQAASIHAVAAALELLQAFLLIQDDIIDRSELRRGRPALHRQLAAWKRERSDSQGDTAYGNAIALLLSDLCLGWALELINESVRDPVVAAGVRACFDRLVTDVNYGQALEMLLMAERTDSLPRSLCVARYKTATYTIVGPLQLGAALAGAGSTLHQAYADIGFPAGEAFQLRDDLLGVFGPPDSTGKSNHDDLREGKPTALFALALQRASHSDRTRLQALYGRPDLDLQQADELRGLLQASGAVQVVEEMIDERAQRALSALSQAPMSRDARDDLAALIQRALYRDR